MVALRDILQRLARYFGHVSRDIGAAAREEVAYGINDVRQHWEAAAYGRPVTPNHWQNRIGRQAGYRDQREGPGANNQQSRAARVQFSPNRERTESDHPRERLQALYGIGTMGDERSNWHNVRQVANGIEPANDNGQQLEMFADMPRGTEEVDPHERIAQLYGASAETDSQELASEQPEFEDVYGPDLFEPADQEHEMEL